MIKSKPIKDDKAHATAIDEYKLLQGIITEHEKHAFTIKAFLSLVLSGLASLVFSTRFEIGPFTCFMIGMGSIAFFALWASEHKVLAKVAIKRAGEIEGWLRRSGGVRNSAYGGPAIGLSFTNFRPGSNRNRGYFSTEKPKEPEKPISKSELFWSRFSALISPIVAVENQDAILHRTMSIPLVLAVLFVLFLSVEAHLNQTSKKEPADVAIGNLSAQHSTNAFDLKFLKGGREYIVAIDSSAHPPKFAQLRSLDCTKSAPDDSQGQPR